MKHINSKLKRAFGFLMAFAMAAALAVPALGVQTFADDEDDYMYLQRFEMSLTPIDVTGMTQAEALVNTGLAQVGKTAFELGFTADNIEGWCADFVYSCANTAGIKKEIIPYLGTPEAIYEYVRVHGGKYVQTAQAGDLVYYYKGHLAIAINSTQAVNGNYGGVDNGGLTYEMTSRVTVAPIAYESWMRNGVDYIIIRPKYSDGSGCSDSDVDELYINDGFDYSTLMRENRVDGLADSYSYDGNWYVFKDKVVDTSVSGIVSNYVGTFYVENGKVNFDYTGLCSNEWGTWYIENGRLTFTYNGLYSDASGDWVIENSLATPYEEPMSEGDLIYDEADGQYHYYENGQPVADKNGFIKWNGEKFIVRDGIADLTATGLICNPENESVWYFCSEGRVLDVTQLVQYDGAWFYVTNGKLNTKFSGLVDYDGSKFIVAAGQIQKQVSGLWQNSKSIGGDDKWYFFSEGQAQTQYTGLAMYDGAWFYVVNGVLAENYTGDVQYDGATFHVVQGMLA